MNPENLTLTDSLVLSLIFITFVFFVLLAISFLVDGTAFFANRKKKREIEEPDSKKTQGAKSSSGSSPTSSAIHPHTIAAISAAIQAYAGEDVRLIVRNIQRESSALTGWEAASIEESLKRS